MFTDMKQITLPLSGMKQPPCFHVHWSVGFTQGTVEMSSLLHDIWSLSWKDLNAQTHLGMLTGHVHVARRVAGF